MRLKIDVSPGEAIDKLTILAIKDERIGDPDKLAHIRREMQALTAALLPLLRRHPVLDRMMADLRQVNERLWALEDDLRQAEKEGRFDAGFVRMARDVYRTNDRRAALNAAINALLGSDIAEQKSYAA